MNLNNSQIIRDSKTSFGFFNNNNVSQIELQGFISNSKKVVGVFEVKNNQVPLDDFFKKIKSEHERLVGYRKETATISLDVAIKTGSVEAFYKQKNSKLIVEKLYPDLDQERKNDVAKFLRVIANDLLFHATLPDEMKQYVNHKRKHSKITFNKVKKE